MKNSKAGVVFLLVVVLAATGFLYWPRPMEGLIRWENPVQAIHLSMQTRQDMTATLGTRSFVLEAGSAEHQALRALFSSFRWHRGFDTLFRDGMTGFQGMSALQFQEMSPGGTMLEVAEGTGIISIDGKAAKIGYLGSGDAKKLLAGALEILPPLTPEE